MKVVNVLACICSAILVCSGMNQQGDSTVKDDNPTNYWATFPTSDDIDIIEIQLDVSAAVQPHTPRLFPKEHPEIKSKTVTDPDLILDIKRSLHPGMPGIAGARLTNQRRNFAEKIGVITFHQGARQYEVTVSNVGFFMGPEMNDFHLFYSWRLAKFVNDVALEAGPGLTQQGFNSLCGVRRIAFAQYYSIVDGKWQHDDINRYESRPAEIWNILPSRRDWLDIKTNDNGKEIK